VLTSEREGFGLPLIEAMACGTPVVATDLEVLREVGGPAIEYCAPGDVPQWCERITAVLTERQKSAEAWGCRVSAGLARAQAFSWTRFAATLVRVYGEVA
jgi:glycosyltransferase involved in cell wall biosynthesis